MLGLPQPLFVCCPQTGMIPESRSALRLVIAIILLSWYTLERHRQEAVNTIRFRLPFYPYRFPKASRRCNHPEFTGGIPS